jgi:hypothetical protein
MSVCKQRHIVWMPQPSGWRLAPMHDGGVTSGGHRMLHELALAIASTGRRTEVRGQFDLSELKSLSAAVGAAPELAAEPRRPALGDVVLMPEGFDDPLTFGHVALSGARKILVLLAPPGLFGWPFVEGWSREPPVDVAIDSVGRAEHFRAIAAMGFELWAPMPQLLDRIKAAGVQGSFIGIGRPVPYPAPLPKRYDVVTLANNRWAELARVVVSRLDPSVVHHEIPPCSNKEVLQQFGQARVLIHPLRVEGDSRIGHEARAMGAVPVVLNTNPFSVGLDDDGGAVAVPTLEEMATAVMELLGDPTRLRELRERGMRSARAQHDWQAYVDRIDAALLRQPTEDPARGARAVIGDRLMRREARIHTELAAEVSRLSRERDALSTELRSERDRILAMQSTRAWRAAGQFWRSRARLLELLGHARSLAGEVPPAEREEPGDDG